MTLALLLAELVRLLRVAVGVAFLLSAVVAITHAMIRRGRLQPFGGWARAVRRGSDRLLAPIERRLRQAGGNPQHAPWWLMGLTAIGGLVAISLLQWLIGVVVQLSYAIQAGPRGLLYVAISLTFSVLMLALIIRVFASWFGLTRYSGPLGLAWRLTDWLVEPIRRLMPPLGMFDFSPLIAWLALSLLRSVILNGL